MDEVVGPDDERLVVDEEGTYKVSPWVSSVVLFSILNGVLEHQVAKLGYIYASGENSVPNYASGENSVPNYARPLAKNQNPQNLTIFR